MEVKGLQADKKPDPNKEFVALEVQRRILEAIKSLKFGSINIIVQDGHVIQIEKLEKERLK